MYIIKLTELNITKPYLYPSAKGVLYTFLNGVALQESQSEFELEFRRNKNKKACKAGKK